MAKRTAKRRAPSAIEEEEDEMFPMAEKRLGDDRNGELGAQMAGPIAA